MNSASLCIRGVVLLNASAWFFVYYEVEGVELMKFSVTEVILVGFKQLF